MGPIRRPLAAILGALALASPSTALAAQCGGDFNAFLAEFAGEAKAQKISPAVIQSAFEGLTPDPRVIQLDRRQGVFKQTFEQFGPPRVNARIAKARQLMSKHAELLSRIEQQFGVPGAVVIAIWGLETDFGVGMGKHPVMRAVATLAHDCRRTEMFQRELMAALTHHQPRRHDQRATARRLGWRDRAHPVPALVLREVCRRFRRQWTARPHSQRAGCARLHRQLPARLWLAGGQPWDEGSQNFSVLKEWNRAQVYQKTIALFANRLMQER